MTALRLLLLLSLVSPAVAADAPSSPSTAPSTKASPSSSTTASSQTRRDMQRHDELGAKAREAVIMGDLDAFRLAMEIAAVQPLPGSYAQQASDFVARARVGSEVKTVEEAAAALGALGGACAWCHQAAPAERFPPSGFETGDEDVLDRMQRHWWATDALWQGLVGPDEAAWKVGAQTLADRSLTQVAGFPKGKAARTRAAALQTAARAALEAPAEPAARGKALGQVLATCADCHQTLQRGPYTTDP